MTNQRHRKVDNPARQATGIHHLAGKHEERHRKQGKTVGSFNDVLREDLRVEHAEMPHQRGAAEQQGECDGHTQRHCK